MKYPKSCILYIIFSFINFIAAESKYVSEITFAGNLSISTSELQSVINLQSPKFFVRSELVQKNSTEIKFL